MSFTSVVKNEVSKLETNESENITELSAIVRNIGNVSDVIQITTENASVARRIYILFKDSYYVQPVVTVRRGYNFNRNYIYILVIKQKVNDILDDLSYQKDDLANIPKEYIYSDDNLIQSYLRGIFLSTGSINDPKKSRYHLEILVDNNEYANFVSRLLNSYELNSKVLKRDNKYMVYMKEAEKIGDFLRIMKTNNALFYYEDIRIYRDHKNMTNRLNNCEQANVDKVIETANSQLKDIELIEQKGSLDLLDDKTKETAIYRKKYPDVSLAELSEIMSIETGKSITKSGLHHRMRKIRELASKMK